MVLFLEGMKTAPAALGAIALATAPVMATLLSVVVKQEVFRWRLMFGAIVAFGGVAYSVLGSGASTRGSLVGVGLVVLSAAFWAVSVVLYRKLLAQESAVRVLTLSFPGAALALVPYGFQSALTVPWHRVTSLGWGALAYLVLVAGVGAFAAYYKGLADVGPARTVLTQFFVPPCAAFFSAVILHDRLVPSEVLGLIIVVAGVALSVVNAPKPLDELGRTESPVLEEAPVATN